MSTYTLDFLIRLRQKLTRLRPWCDDAYAAERDGPRYDFNYVDQSGFERHAPTTFAALAGGFTEYKLQP